MATTNKTPAETKRLRIVDVDLKELIPVYNATGGTLVYRSRDGFYAKWTGFNDCVMFTVEELSKMRKEQPGFFIRQFVSLGGDNAADVMNFLQVEQYYLNMPELDSVDSLFKKTPKQFETEVKSFSNTMKEAIARRAYALYKEGSLDSIKMINAVKKATGFDIREAVIEVG